MILQDGYCEKCDKIYTNLEYKWCKPCQIDYLKKNLTSGNEKINKFIQEMQLKINNYYDVVSEWIPYNQFENIKEIGKDGFATIYSAIWKDGPLYYNEYKKIYRRNLRNQDQKVLLKYFNSQNITDEFFNEVQTVVQNFFMNLFYFCFLITFFCFNRLTNIQ